MARLKGKAARPASPGCVATHQHAKEPRTRLRGLRAESESSLISDTSALLVPKLSTPSKQTRQIRLAPLKALGSPRVQATWDICDEAPKARRSRPRAQARDQPQAVCKPEKIPISPARSSTKDAEPGDEVEQTDVEQSIWCGSEASSDSDEELPSPRLFLRSPRKAGPNANSLQPRSNSHELPFRMRALSVSDTEDDQPVTKPATTKPQKAGPSAPRPLSSSDKENDAVIRFSPPRLFSPRRCISNDRPVTPPPASPSKSRLVSPSKKNVRIPIAPLRPSLDAFWTSEAVNDWNDQYSPQKPLKSPRKLKLVQDDNSTSPTSSPRKLASSSKRTKAELEAKKSFNERKIRLAESFLSELDQSVTKGKVAELAASAGGVKLIWSKTLNSTAGRANWRRETTKTRHPSTDTTTVTHKHFASIELAEKVIDDEDRLLNVLTHEFCHLANFMVSGIKDQPHGKQFKAWGKLCTQAFKERGVEVTTKHTYEIDYKYAWQCSSEDCGVEFKRHSKSIDPMKHRCGSCRSLLVQIKPVPRRSATDAAAKSSASGGVAGYAGFVKLHFTGLKKSMPGASHKEVMEALGRKYRAEKQMVAGGCPEPDSRKATPEIIDLVEDADEEVLAMTKAVKEVKLN